MTVRRSRRSSLEDFQNVTVRIDLAFMPACHPSCLRFPLFIVFRQFMQSRILLFFLA